MSTMVTDLVEVRATPTYYPIFIVQNRWRSHWECIPRWNLGTSTNIKLLTFVQTRLIASLNYLLKPLAREVEGRQMQFSS